MNLRDVVVKPIVTEKGSLEKHNNRYVFAVNQVSTKIDIKNAIEKIFNVKVKDVNTVRVKSKITGAIRGRIGRTRSWKKAYVTLRSGQKIESLEN